MRKIEWSPITNKFGILLEFVNSSWSREMKRVVLHMFLITLEYADLMKTMACFLSDCLVALVP